MPYLQITTYYTTDTVSGLDWLDVTLSVNRSYNDVSSQFGVGGDFEGWRYATGIEFNDLAGRHTGISATGYNIVDTTGTTPSTDLLVYLLGSTLDAFSIQGIGMTYDASIGVAEGEGQDYTLGLLADASDSTGHYRATLLDTEINAFDFYKAHDGALDDTLAMYSSGSFLVRNTLVSSVAEPTTFPLLCLGLLSILCSRRNKRSQFYINIKYIMYLKAAFFSGLSEPNPTLQTQT